MNLQSIKHDYLFRHANLGQDWPNFNKFKISAQKWSIPYTDCILWTGVYS